MASKKKRVSISTTEESSSSSFVSDRHYGPTGPAGRPGRRGSHGPHGGTGQQGLPGFYSQTVTYNSGDLVTDGTFPTNSLVAFLRPGQGASVYNSATVPTSTALVLAQRDTSFEIGPNQLYTFVLTTVLTSTVVTNLTYNVNWAIFQNSSNSTISGAIAAATQVEGGSQVINWIANNPGSQTSEFTLFTASTARYNWFTLQVTFSQPNSSVVTAPVTVDFLGTILLAKTQI